MGGVLYFHTYTTSGAGSAAKKAPLKGSRMQSGLRPVTGKPYDSFTIFPVICSIVISSICTRDAAFMTSASHSSGVG